MARSFIDPTSQTPIFQQIVDELEKRILTGELSAGDFLPSVREFAVANSVNPNTIAKAYQQLQSLGLVESV
ncbi:MAG: GntR family transcriptional regulator, partial [Bdellovibrionota bacterium]